jgi:ribosomal protein L37E
MVPIASKTQRTLLLSFLASIAACGMVGVYCLVAGNLGRIEGAVLVSVALVGAASILGLACAITWERRRWHPIGPIGVLCVLFTFAVSLALIWLDAYAIRTPNWVWKIMASSWTVAVAVPHAGLLALARLRTGYCWVRRWTIVCIAGTAALIVYLIIDDPTPFEVFRQLMRLLGVLAIGVVCGTLAIPILHRVSSIRTREAVRTTELRLELKCPRCLTQQHVPAGHSKCVSCGLKLKIEIEEEQCATCGYPLYKLESSQCPECGTPIARQQTAETAGAAP